MKNGKHDYMTASPDRYKQLKEFAKANRQKATVAERILWEYLRMIPQPFKFRRQHIIGDYIADFACVEAELIIELDGAYHTEPRQQEDDQLRTEALNRMGYQVIRYTNEQVMENPEGITEDIKDLLNEKDFII